MGVWSRSSLPRLVQSSPLPTTVCHITASMNPLIEMDVTLTYFFPCIEMFVKGLGKNSFSLIPCVNEVCVKVMFSLHFCLFNRREDVRGGR